MAGGVRREPRARYLPIAEHGLIGDLHTVALVGTDGTIDWYCSPRFDSPSVFAAILDADHGGLFRIPPDLQERFLAWKRHAKARLITLVIQSTPGDLTAISDEVHEVPSLSVTEAAVERVLSV